MARKILKYVGRVLLVILVTAVMLVGILYLMIYKCCNGPSPAAKSTMITTILETGQMKFVASLVCSKEEIQKVVDANKLKPMDTDIDESLITINPSVDDDPEQPNTNPNDPYADEVFDENGIRMEEIAGRSFFAKLLIIKDPSQVCVTSVTKDINSQNAWPEYGSELKTLCENVNGVAAVNGGLYVSQGNKGGQPIGVVVQDGHITLNRPSDDNGLYMIGFDKNNILTIKDLSGMNPTSFKEYVEEKGIRDAITFQEESSDSNNHFVTLVINGEGRELKGAGSGANPRTAIGQRADGAILILVTDGRGASGHLGATASDLIGIMLDHGAINAANLDGGSSSSMYYNGKYEMTSVTFYYQNSSWKLPTGFAIKKKQ